MKKIVVGSLGLLTIFTLFGCHKIKDEVERMENTSHERIEDVRVILDKVLEHIAENNQNLSFENGELVDSELGIPHFNIAPISEMPHFNEKDVVDGFVVRPMVDVDNPKLIIFVEAVDKDASNNLNNAMMKVKSDQHAQFQNDGMMKNYLIDNNRLVSHGNHLIYVTWEDAESIVGVFEQYIR